MSIWLVLLDVLGVLLLLVLCYGIALIVRRRVLSRNGGTFELSYRRQKDRPDRGWVLGMGRYTGDSLECFRIFSLTPRPTHVWHREEISYAGQRRAEGAEQMSLYADHVVVSCKTPHGTIELAMSPASLMGFQAWLEAGPPGTNWDLRPVR